MMVSEVYPAKSRYVRKEDGIVIPWKDAMTARETIEIISNSSLWKMLSVGERLEAAAYAMHIAGVNIDDEDVNDIIGEVYVG